MRMQCVAAKAGGTTQSGFLTTWKNRAATATARAERQHVEQIDPGDRRAHRIRCRQLLQPGDVADRAGGRGAERHAERADGLERGGGDALLPGRATPMARTVMWTWKMPMPKPTSGAQISTQTKCAPEAAKASPTEPIMRQIGPAMTTLRSRLPCSPAESAAAIDQPIDIRPLASPT